MRIRSPLFWKIAIGAPIPDRAYYWLLDHFDPDHLPGWRPLGYRQRRLLGAPRSWSELRHVRRSARRTSSRRAVR